MNGIIIYQGKYGATQQYATWLAEALKLPMVEADVAPAYILFKYDFIILGSSVYVGQLLIKQWLKQNMAPLTNKKLLLFVVSGSTTNNAMLQQKVLDANLNPALSKSVKTFFLPGRCVISQLSLLDRIMLKIGSWLEKDPANKKIMQNGFDNMDHKALVPLIEAVKAFED